MTFLVSTNAPSRYNDELLNFGSRCASKRTFKESFGFDQESLSSLLLVKWPYEFSGKFYGSERNHVPFQGKVLKIDIRDVDLGFSF